jgi:hypothetical protein
MTTGLCLDTAGAGGKGGLIVMSVMSGIGGGTRTQEHLHVGPVSMYESNAVIDEYNGELR